ncbi:MAG: hypothetical protein U0228_32935 [Myxococcaceae bacterium]
MNPLLRTLPLVVLCAGCAPLDAPHVRAVATTPSATSQPLGRCRAGLPPGSRLLATKGGALLTVPRETGLEVFDHQGRGCELAAAGSRSVLELLDADENGTLYAFPLDASFRGATVARLDRFGTATELVPGGRGIWGFGVSPSGRTMWVSACGPTGILSTADWRQQAMPAPATLWEQSGGVLTADDVFWSIGVRELDDGACRWDAPLTPSCGLGLVRTTPAGDVRVGDTVLDFGHGFETGALTRCGDGVCVFTPHGVAAWSGEGQLRVHLALDALGAAPDATITGASANEQGLYVALSTSEFVFTPWSELSAAR